MSFLRNVRSRILGGAVDDLSVQEASVTDELAAAGRAFGTLMEQVGTAVALTQQQLDRNGAAIAEEMCNAEVDIIRARETVYDEETGKVKEVVVVAGQGRLIELASPVFYEYQYLTLQGEFTATELATSTQTKVQRADATVRAGGGSSRGRGKRKASGGVSASVSASSSDVTTGTTFDSSVGTIRMNTLIAPKESVGIPKPPLVLVGPRIAIAAVASTAVAAALDVIPGREATVTVTVTKVVKATGAGAETETETEAGTGTGTATGMEDKVMPVKQQLLAIDAGEAEWSVVVGGLPRTNDAGEVVLRLFRPQPEGAPLLASKQVPVTVRLGLVNANASVRV
jgi:hypothetical protein